MRFFCTSCGCCCRSIGKMIASCAALIAHADSIDEEIPDLIREIADFPHMFDKEGCCEMLNKSTNLCTVYYNRPRVCNTDRMYLDFYSRLMSREEWYQMSKLSCAKLQARTKEENELHNI